MSHHSHCDDCGWTSNPCGSPRQADYARRKHSCDLHRVRLARAQRVLDRKNASGPARDCTHYDEHGRPRHAHGERNAYVLDRCRCRACRDAAAAYERDRNRAHLYGRFTGLTDATPARDHVRRLQAQGMGWKRIARAAGLDTSVVWKLLYGDPSRGQAPSKRVKPATADALLAVTLDVAPGTPIDPTGTRRRLQGLVALGWSQSSLGRRLGILPGNLNKLFHGTSGVTAGTAAKVLALYDELWDQAPPTETKWQKIAKANALNGARRNGWVPPLAWDDDTIDDPDARPDTGSVLRHANGTRRRIDVVIEDVEHLLATGCGRHEITRRVGYKNQRDLARVLHRAGRSDLAGVLERYSNREKKAS